MANSYLVLKDYPAVQYFDDGNFSVHDGMQFHIEGVTGSLFFGSVVDMATKNGECPKEAIEREEERGYDAFFAYNCGSSVTAHKRKKEFVRQFNFGDVVYYHGRMFKLEPAHNSNVKLIQVGAY